MVTTLSPTVAALYPQCVSLRKELDVVLLALSAPPMPPASAIVTGEWVGGGASFGSTSTKSVSSGKECRGIASIQVAKLQRLGALTRQFCVLVLQLQDAFERERKEVIPRNMESLWERRVRGLVADAESFRREAEERMSFEQQRVADAMRERRALLGEGVASGKQWGDVRNAELMHARERDRLQDSHTMLDSVIAQGWGIVGQLVFQNASLKNTKRKVLDMASNAGVASTLLGAVGRRQQSDKWLVYGGMIATIIFFFVVYRLFHYGCIFGFFSSVPESGAGSEFDGMDITD